VAHWGSLFSTEYLDCKHAVLDSGASIGAPEIFSHGWPVLGDAKVHLTISTTTAAPLAPDGAYDIRTYPTCWETTIIMALAWPVKLANRSSPRKRADRNPSDDEEQSK
jgi:hypothetical protein